MTKIYTGIGSRETPGEIANQMSLIGMTLAFDGWTLRSGHAAGADLAFENGAKDIPSGAMEIYLPWATFNSPPKNDPHYIDVRKLPNWEEARVIAEQFHPAWGKCDTNARLFHTRNVYQILGADLNTRSDLVICWTKNGKQQGGTGQALRLANYLNIPVFDLAIHSLDQVQAFINEKWP